MGREVQVRVVLTEGRDLGFHGYAGGGGGTRRRAVVRADATDAERVRAERRVPRLPAHEAHQRRARVLQGGALRQARGT